MENTIERYFITKTGQCKPESQIDNIKTDPILNSHNSNNKLYGRVFNLQLIIFALYYLSIDYVFFIHKGNEYDKNNNRRKYNGIIGFHLKFDRFDIHFLEC